MPRDLKLRQLPSLPVLGWQGVSIRQRLAPLPAVTQDRDVIFTSSGRAAIFLAMEALGVESGDRVLVPTYHCPTMIAPVARLGATPLFYPITAAAAPDLDWLTSADTTGVKAMLAAHYFGLPQPMSAIKQFCAARGIALIEDCAHAYFGTNEGTSVGALGDLTIASLPKFFPVLEGGCLIGPPALLSRIEVSRAPWLDQLKSLVDIAEVGALHGRLGLVGRAIDRASRVKRALRNRRHEQQPADGPVANSDHGVWLPDERLRRRATAATQWIVSHCDLTRLVQRRRENYALWSRLMRDTAGARVLFPELPDTAAPYVFPLWVQDPESKYQTVRANGIPVFRWDIAWPGVPRFPNDVGRGWLSEVFQLGCHQDLTESDIQQMASTVRRLLEADSAE